MQADIKRILQMKKLGLIGGMGPQSTMPYYMGIVYGVQEKTSKDFFPNLTIESLNVFEILKMIGDGRLEELTDHFVNALENLKKAGADFAALTANTAHIVFDQLEKRSPLPLVSIIDSTCDEALKRGYSRIGLLGTRFTMEQEFYRKPFIENGIEIIIPDNKEREFINDRISSELEFGAVNAETQREFINIIKRMRDNYRIDAIVLGCTELPLILDDKNSPVPTLDTVKIHTEDLIRHILD